MNISGRREQHKQTHGGRDIQDRLGLAEGKSALWVEILEDKTGRDQIIRGVESETQDLRSWLTGRHQRFQSTVTKLVHTCKTV